MDNELKNFCSDNLAYLVDKGFKIVCRTDFQDISILIYLYSSTKVKNGLNFLRLGNRFNWDTFYWFDVCDDIMPFIQLLALEYEPCKDFLVFHCNNGDKQTWKDTLTLKRAESGYNSFDRELCYIEIRIKNEYENN